MDKIEMIWLGACIVLFVLEAVTVNLISIWFALGALAALVVALIGGPLWLQIVTFLIVTILTLWATRPLVKKHFNNKHEPTNADVVIGKVCIVTEDIDNTIASGQVTCMGKTWTARSATGEPITKGNKATVNSIEGVKLMVSPLVENVHG